MRLAAQSGATMPYGGSASILPPSWHSRQKSATAQRWPLTGRRRSASRVSVCFGLCFESLVAAGCANANPVGPYWTASPLIVPDAATVRPGASQTFRVQNAPVVQFRLSADQQDWSGCVAIDPAFNEANGIRLLALHRCRGPVYVSATLGEQRSPLVAVLSVE